MRPAETTRVWRKTGRQHARRTVRETRRPTARELRSMRDARVMTLAQLPGSNVAVLTRKAG